MHTYNLPAEIRCNSELDTNNFRNIILIFLNREINSHFLDKYSHFLKYGSFYSKKKAHYIK
jgi:hypothetical protein